VRGADAAGFQSAWVASAPFRLDTTPPAAPSASIAALGDGVVQIEFTDTTDSGSGIDPDGHDVGYCRPAPCTPTTPQVSNATSPADVHPEGGCGEVSVSVRTRDVAGNAGPWASVTTVPCAAMKRCDEASGACAPKCGPDTCEPALWCDPYTTGPAPACVPKCLSAAQPGPVPPATAMPSECGEATTCDTTTGRCCWDFEGVACGVPQFAGTFAVALLNEFDATTGGNPVERPAFATGAPAAVLNERDPTATDSVTQSLARLASASPASVLNEVDPTAALPDGGTAASLASAAPTSVLNEADPTEQFDGGTAGNATAPAAAVLNNADPTESSPPIAGSALVCVSRP